MARDGTLPVALTCGEPAGVGPELAVAAWRALGKEMPFFWIGDPRHLADAADIAVIDSPGDAVEVSAEALPVLAHAFPEPAVPGRPTPANARAVIEVIERGVDLVRTGLASALCTAPIAKKVLTDWGDFRHHGHTEFLAELGGARQVVMMLASDELKVVPATIHIPLADVPAALTAESLAGTIRITEAALRRDFGLDRPRIAVSGLNPHAGEGGLLGEEDGRLIAPVVEMLRDEGLDVFGPLPADTMFHAPARARYDAAVAMYHDQALIPIKTLAFDRGVNVTLGLPFVRTSPDHGTAFDIAGKGLADPTSLIEALKLADRMARTRARM